MMSAVGKEPPDAAFKPDIATTSSTAKISCTVHTQNTEDSDDNTTSRSPD